MTAQLAHLLSVLTGRVDVGPRRCDHCHREVTAISRRRYRRWLAARACVPGPRLECVCGGVLVATPADLVGTWRR